MLWTGVCRDESTTLKTTKSTSFIAIAPFRSDCACSCRLYKPGQHTHFMTLVGVEIKEGMQIRLPVTKGKLNSCLNDNGCSDSFPLIFMDIDNKYD